MTRYSNQDYSKSDLAKIFAIVAVVGVICVPLIAKLTDASQAMDGCQRVKGEEVKAAMSAIPQTPFFWIPKKDGCKEGYAKPAVK